MTPVSVRLSVRLSVTSRCCTYCMRDRLPTKEICSGSRDFFKFWEITDNVSETVQDGDVVTTDQ